MMTEIVFNLSVDEIKRAKKEIRKYKTNIKSKCRKFISKLAQCGIKVAKQNKGELGEYITFKKEISTTKYGATGVMCGVSPYVWQFWIGSDGLAKAADIMPILMAEFGSGSKASDANNLPNEEIAIMLDMGRGTFPGQTHAFEDEWYWQDLKGEWHSSQGFEPTMPMFKALVEMRSQIEQIVKEVFQP